ncbi:MAG: peptide MFS transporter [Hyphomicrobium sp.]|uniref:peptide MFS transporter n=1 Tax=Hyphomicrobium sp. TaxID=82 RepID=UPI001328E4C8|nr:peptide MFS transporter [Hyphomicrobium sp.]KAB2940804.1 MAG: peptide MFS transporter [Hyphomicrobium sp.]MBZ0210038.1 peptide MFS transporter [Hyphomicrobium sp.]
MAETGAGAGSSGTMAFAGQPRGLSTLFFTELWERFSYYGMRALLTLFIVAPMPAGGLGLSAVEAARIYGNYTMAVYLLSIPGGFIADRYLGAHRSVIIGGTIIALGHFTLAVPAEITFYLGLALVALGTGLFKPNISAMVGGLYAPADERRDAGFSIFYMGINIGGLLAPLVTGFLAQSDLFKSWLAANGFDPAASWHWGFGAAGVGMTLGLIGYVLQAKRLENVGRTPPVAGGSWATSFIVIVGALAIMGLTVLSDEPRFQWLRAAFLLLPVAAIFWFAARGDIDGERMAAMFVFFIASMLFWAIFEQAGISIALFGLELTRNEVFGWSFPAAWYQSLNPLFVILLAPLFALLWLRLGPRQPSSPVKFAFGLFFLGLSFLLMVPAAMLTAEGRVSPLWLVGLFFLQTVGELCLSPVGLSTITKLAPARLVGLVLGVWFLSMAWGNKLAGVLGGGFTASDPGALSTFFLQQASMVGAATLALVALIPWLKHLMRGVR